MVKVHIFNELMRVFPPAVPNTAALRMLVAIICTITCAAAPTVAVPSDRPGGLKMAGRAAVAAVEEDATLVLDDGRHVRLAGVEVVRPPAGAPPGGRRRLADAALGVLRGWIGGTSVVAWVEREEADRYGRVVAHLRRDDGVWLQDLVLAEGLARVRPVVGDVARSEEMLAVEEMARRSLKGMWATRVFAVRDAADAEGVARSADELTLVEGVVRRAEMRRGRLYLDFGDDWRRDFTATAASAVARRWLARGGDPGTLVGRRVRVRGWPHWRFGPSVDLDVAEQMEFLD